FLLISAHFTATPGIPVSLPTSSMPVSTAKPKLSPGLSQQTRHTAYELFTPNNSGQRSDPTYYRGCWHVVSRSLFPTYRQPGEHPEPALVVKEVYNPKAVIPTRRRCVRLSPIAQDSPL